MVDICQSLGLGAQRAVITQRFLSFAEFHTVAVNLTCWKAKGTAILILFLMKMYNFIVKID